MCSATPEHCRPRCRRYWKGNAPASKLALLVTDMAGYVRPSQQSRQTGTGGYETLIEPKSEVGGHSFSVEELGIIQQYCATVETHTAVRAEKKQTIADKIQKSLSASCPPAPQAPPSRDAHPHPLLTTRVRRP